MATNLDSIDANRINTLMGEGDFGESLPIQVDPVTGNVLVEVHYVSSETESTPITRALHDANHVPTFTGVSTADLVTPLSVAMSQATGYLLVQLT